MAILKDFENSDGEISPIRDSQKLKKGNVDVKDKTAVGNPIAKTNDEEQSVTLRAGPNYQKYLFEFIDYLRCRTGFKFENFTAPTQLIKAMMRMEAVQLPIKIFHAFINVSIRLLGLSDNEFVNSSEFVKVLVVVLSIVVDYYLEYFLLRAALRVLSSWSTKYLTPIIIAIYHFLNFCLKKLWKYVEKRIEEYSVLLLDKVRSSYQRPKLQ
ncbi:hypothetical protein PV327_008935 [Microctonus hyperodae]|uniref:Uncharacterized protein n=1 Tax=Microctonus hyperodae TaxID=165561 RepID=A0AA39FTF1_MICHY|nr:hypothetical protein PV327_008935 [Microctonus hyperodae]